MSKTLTRRLLWAALVLTVPAPMWFIGGGRLPVMALFQISTYMAVVSVSEGGPGAWLACWSIGVQGLFWALILYVAARLATSALARASGDTAPAPAVGALIVALFAISLFNIYSAPIVGRGAPVNILGVY